MDSRFKSIATLCFLVSLLYGQVDSTPVQPYRPCSCTGMFPKQNLDCSSRGRTDVGPNDKCKGHVTKINLYQNSFSKFPPSLSASIVEINISSNHLTSVPRPPQLNTKATVLDISDNRITHASDELRLLNKLKVFRVSGNRLNTLSFLPESCGLEQLWAARNTFRAIDTGLRRCSSLEDLDLSDNQLNVLPAEVMSQLRKLRSLKLARMGLIKLETNTFRGLDKLKYLDLSGNNLNTIPSKALSSLKNLDELHLQANKLTSLSSDAFHGMGDLKKLSLFNNQLTSLSSELLKGLKDLKSIVLSFNKLKQIPRGLFSGLRKLENVNLWHNEIEALPDAVFSGLQHLKSIGLAYNRLSALPVSMLNGLSNLQSLDLQHNLLMALPANLFKDTKSLQYLYLPSNRLSNFDGSLLAGVKSLEVLQLENNHLTHLPTFDKKWPKVEYAMFTRNRFTEVSETTLRSWLEAASSTKLVVLATPDAPALRNPESLRWIFSEPKVVATADAQCNCGTVRRGKTEVRLCVAVRCGTAGAPRDWIAAVRAPPPGGHSRH